MKGESAEKAKKALDAHTEEIKAPPTESGDEHPVSLATYPVTPALEEIINRRFTHHSPKGNQGDRYSAIRAMMANTARELAALCPTSHELDIAVAKLEEAMFWSNASIARNE